MRQRRGAAVVFFEPYRPHATEHRIDLAAGAARRGADIAPTWVLLPPAALVAGLAPAVVSFAAGQAAFTVTRLSLLGILARTAGRSSACGSIVALGGAVGLAVGLLP